MTFTLTTAGDFYTHEQAEPLKELGFEFESTDFANYDLIKTKDGQTTTIEINTLEELMGLIKKYGRVVVYEDSITIYDDYLE